MIGTDHMGGEFIEALRPEVQVMNLGARVLAGLRENVSIPRMPAGTQAEWIAEDAAANESTPTFDNVTLTLKQLSARTRMSRGSSSSRCLVSTQSSRTTFAGRLPSRSGGNGRRRLGE